MAALGAGMTALAEALAGPLSKMFVGYDAELFAMTLRGFRIYALAFTITGFSIFGSSLFTALNNGLVSAAVSFLRTLAFQITAVMVFPIFWGLDGVWSAICFAELFSLVTTAAFVLAFRKKYGYF